MEEFDNDVEILILKYLQQTLTREEAKKLKVWIDTSPDNRELFEKLTNYQYLNDELGKMYGYDSEKGWAAVKKKMPLLNVTVVTPGNKPWHLYKFYLLKRVTVAAVLLMLAAGIYLLTTGRSTGIDNRLAGKSPDKPTDVLPGQRKATLILDDGSTINLDIRGNGTVAKQGNANIIKSGGKLTYQTANYPVKKILYNTIFNPRGAKQYELVLADGSTVWLNAESSIRFPTAFSHAERRVEITGEAYFEVAANKRKPFVVSVRGAEVQVYGTHFNVMAYADEAHLVTTLLKGAVSFKNRDQTIQLQPGEQSLMNALGLIKVVKNVNVGEVMAWKNDAFFFEKADIETVMRQVARYYDVEVIYRRDKPKDLLHADIPRNTRLSEVLKALEIAGGIRCKIDGQKVLVI